MIKLAEGTILLQETCDEIHFDLQGNFEEVNPHTEHWLVKDVTTNSYVLYNLDTQRTRNVSKEEMQYALRGNKKYGIKPIFQISKEVG